MPEERPNGERALILRQLTRRIGELTPDMQQKIQSLSLAQIEALGEALLGFVGMDDLVGWLRENA